MEIDLTLLLVRPVYNRIPNCKGAIAAGQKLAALEEFASAKCVEVGPDKAQEEVRYQALLAGKSLVVPTPRLSGQKETIQIVGWHCSVIHISLQVASSTVSVRRPDAAMTISESWRPGEGSTRRANRSQWHPDSR